MALKDLVPDYIRAIVPYPPGKPIEELERELGISDSIKIASNENPLGPSPKAMKAIEDFLPNLHRYPDGSVYYLKEKLADKLGVSPGNLILGNGSNEIIEFLIRALIVPGKEAVMADQAFIIYRIIMQSVGGTNRIVPLKNFTHDLEAMANEINAETRLLFIANPNNPTGTIVTRPEFERLLEKVPEHVVVVLDEAYFEFVNDPDYPSSIDYINETRCVIGLRTFSKAYGLSGLRLGYGIANEELVDALDRIRQPFNVNSVAQVAALHALDDQEHLERTMENNREGMNFLTERLRDMGYNWVPSQANFILIDLQEEAEALYRRLLPEGVIVRSMAGYGLKEFIRVTIGTHEENRRFIEALVKVGNKRS